MKPYPQYKDSGIEWLGEIPDHWEKIKLRYLFEIRKQIAGEIGYDILSITQQGIKIKDIKNMDGQISSDYSKYQYVKKGYFAMNHMDLLTGYVDISEYDGVTSPDYRVFSLSTTDYHDRYFLYLFQIGYKRKIFYAFGQGAAHFGRWRFPTEEFRAFEFPIPQIQEQTAIANFLDRKTTEIDSIITKKERLIELYEEEKAAVINHTVTKGLDPAAKMKDSGIEWLGEIPEHWEVKRLKFIKSQEKNSFVDGPFGSHLKSEHFIDDGDVYVIDSGCITSGDFIQKNDFRTISMQHFETIKRSECRENDIIIAKIGANFGMSGILPKLDKLSVVSGNSLKLTVRKDYQLNLIHYQLLNLKRLGIIDIEVKGSAQPALSMQLMSDMPFLKANMKEQTAIVQYIETKCSHIDAIISKFKRQIELLKEYRTALISEAVTGKIDLRHEI